MNLYLFSGNLMIGTLLLAEAAFPIEPPQQGVQIAFWYVISAIAILGGLGITAWRTSKWIRGEILSVVHGAIRSGVESALKAHEEREQGWRSEDRRSFHTEQNQIRSEFKDAISGLASRFGEVNGRFETLERRIDMLLHRPRNQRGSDLPD